MLFDSQYIDLERYPIHQPGSTNYTVLLGRIREELAHDGCAVLKGFLNKSGVKAVCAEADEQSRHGFASTAKTNAYFGRDDPGLPQTHPIRRFYERSNAFIAADYFKADGPLRSVHDSPGFDDFIQSCLQVNEFHRYADPLADVIVNQATEGNGFPWHFDTNNFTVTLAIQNAESGGDFEYAANIRRDHENFEAVQAVLDETSDDVRRITLEPGDLQLFKGRYSLRR